MPWVRHILGEPPTAQDMENWESEGWSEFHVIGPCPAKEENSPRPRMVYVVYLRRSIIEVGRQVTTLGRPN